MWYIIIAILVIGVIVVLAKYVLFHPQANSVVSIIVYIWMLVTISSDGPELTFAAFLMLLIPIIDCIRDIIIAPRYYRIDIDIELDKLYVVKSLTSLFTFGFSRIVFLLVVDPHIACSVRRSLKWEICAGRRLTGSTGRHGEYIGWHIMSGARWYHFNKQVNRLEKRGIAVSNEETGVQETQESRKNWRDFILKN